MKLFKRGPTQFFEKTEGLTKALYNREKVRRAIVRQNQRSMHAAIFTEFLGVRPSIVKLVMSVQTRLRAQSQIIIPIPSLKEKNSELFILETIKKKDFCKKISAVQYVV